MRKFKAYKIVSWAVLLSFINLLVYQEPLFRSAFAADYSVMIIPPSPDGSLSTELSDSLARAFKDTGRFDVVPRGEVEGFLSAKTGTSTQKNYDKIFNEAVQLLSKGEKLYNSLKVDKAIATLQESKLKFKEAMPSINTESDYSRYLGTFFYLAMAYQAKGQEEQGINEIRQMVVMDPERKTRKFSSKYYPPALLKLYEKIKKGVLKGEKGKLRIKTNPRGAQVYVDSKLLGNTPVEISKVPLGEHFVVVEKSGYSKWADSKFVVEGKNIVELDLQPKSGADGFLEISTVSSSYNIPRKTASVLDEMGVTLGGDVFLLYQFSAKGSKGTIKAQLYDQRNQEVSQVQSVKIANLDDPDSGFSELARRLTLSLSVEGYVVGGKKDVVAEIPKQDDLPPDYSDPQDNVFMPEEDDTPKNWRTLPPKRPGQSKSWYEKWWVWSAIAGGILLTTGSVLLFTDIAKGSPNTSTLVIRK